MDSQGNIYVVDTDNSLIQKFTSDGVFLIISYDTVAQKFLTYKPTFPETSPTNVVVKGGVAYLVMMNKAKSVTFTGELLEMPPIVSPD